MSADQAIAAALAAAIRRHGHDWCTDPRRCPAMLADLIPRHPRVINILIEAVEAGVVRDLTTSRSTLPAAVLIARSVRRVHDEMSLREDMARRAVTLWALALGLEVPPDVIAAGIDTGIASAPVATTPGTRPSPALQAGPMLQPTQAPQSAPDQAPSSRAGWPWKAIAVAVAAIVGLVVAATWPPMTTVPDDEPPAEVAVPEPVTPPPAPAPRATALRVASDQAFKAGDDVEFAVTFSRAVTVTGAPRIRFHVAGDRTSREALFARGDGTDRMTFLFEVPEGRIDGSGVELDPPPAIDPAGGTIVDATTGQPADLALDPPPNLAGVRIDGSGPTVRMVKPPSGRGDRTTGDRLEFRVEFDEEVAVEGKPGLTVRAGGRTRQAEFTGGDGRTLTFASTVAAGDESDDGVTATALVLGGGAIRDLAGNPASTSFAAVRSAPFKINPPQPPPGQALYEEGRRLWLGEGTKIDEPNALDAFRAAAEKGHPLACMRVAESFEYGWGGTRANQFEEADRWYRRGLPGLVTLADRGDVDALVDHGRLLVYGRAIARDVAGGMRLVRRAAESGQPHALKVLANLVEATTDSDDGRREAVALLRRASADGSLGARRDLGLRYSNGSGVDKDEQEAARLLLETARANDQEAIHQLAHLIQEGRGLAKDEPFAVRLFTEAYEQADSHFGASCFAACYFDGQGVAKDEGRGLEILAAAAADQPYAQLELADRISAGRGVKQDQKKAEGWYRTAFACFEKRANRGDEEAAMQVGWMHAQGIGTAKDVSQARRWYERARRSPFPKVAAQAAEQLATLDREGNAP